MHEQRERDISRHAKTSTTYLLVPDGKRDLYARTEREIYLDTPRHLLPTCWYLMAKETYMLEQRERDISRHAKTSTTYLLVPDARPHPIVAIGLILGNFRVGKIVRHARAPPQLRRVANRFQRGTCTSRYRHLLTYFFALPRTNTLFSEQTRVSSLFSEQTVVSSLLSRFRGPLYRHFIRLFTRIDRSLYGHLIRLFTRIGRSLYRHFGRALFSHLLPLCTGIGRALYNRIGTIGFVQSACTQSACRVLYSRSVGLCTVILVGLCVVIWYHSVHVLVEW